MVFTLMWPGPTLRQSLTTVSDYTYHSSALFFCLDDLGLSDSYAVTISGFDGCRLRTIFSPPDAGNVIAKHSWAAKILSKSQRFHLVEIPHPSEMD